MTGRRKAIDRANLGNQDGGSSFTDSLDRGDRSPFFRTYRVVILS